MDTQHPDSQEDKLFPGTLLDSDHPQHHKSHQHRHSLSYNTPALVEVKFDLLKAKIIAFFFLLFSFMFILKVLFDIQLYLN